MKTNKILLVIMLIFTAILFNACNEKTNYMEFYQDEIVVNLESSVALKYKEYGVITNKNIEVQNDLIAKYQSGRIFGLTIGETTLVITYNDTERVEIKIKVIDKTHYVINLQDREINSKNYENFLDKLNIINDTFKNGTSFICEGYSSENLYKESYSYKVSASPLYIESYSEGNSTVIKQEGSHLFEYSCGSEYVRKNYLGEIEGFDSSEYNYGNVDSNLTLIFDPDKGNIYENGNEYTLISHYKDSIIPEFEAPLKQLCSLSNISYDEISKTIITRKVTIEENSISLYCKFYLKIEKEHFSIEAYEKITMTEFEKIDVDNENYKLLIPSSMGGAYDIVDYDSELYTSSIDGYLKVDAKKGALYIIDEFNCEDLYINLYNENKDLVGKALGNYGEDLLQGLNSCIIIPEDGIYYLEVINEKQIKRKFKIQNIEYNNVGNINEGIKLNDNNEYNGTIEGKYDFVFYNTNIDDIGSLCITNTGNSPLYLINVKGDDIDSNGIIKINPNQNILYSFINNQNVFAICNLFTDKTDVLRYDYSFEVKYVDRYGWELLSYAELGKEIVCDEKYNDYKKYIIYLEEGQYTLTSTNDRMHLEVYKSKSFNTNITVTKGENDFEKIITVTKSGFYYIEIKDNQIGDKIIIN